MFFSQNEQHKLRCPYCGAEIITTLPGLGRQKVSVVRSGFFLPGGDMTIQCRRCRRNVGIQVRY